MADFECMTTLRHDVLNSQASPRGLDGKPCEMTEPGQADLAAGNGLVMASRGVISGHADSLSMCILLYKAGDGG